MDTKTTPSENMCGRCGTAQIVREQLEMLCDLHVKIGELECQLKHHGIRPCTRENEAVCVPLSLRKKNVKKSEILTFRAVIKPLKC